MPSRFASQARFAPGGVPLPLIWRRARDSHASRSMRTAQQSRKSLGKPEFSLSTIGEMAELKSEARFFIVRAAAPVSPMPLS